MKYIEAKGSHYQIGQTIGQKTKSLIKRSILNYKKYFKQITETNFNINDGLLIAQKYWASAKKYTPRSWQMMQGIAKGAGINFKYIFLVNAWEEVEHDLDQRVEKCTSLVAKSPDGVFLAHNEDWYKFDAA